MNPSIRTARELLEAFSARATCVDIGAAGGLHKRVEGISPRATIIAFDADEEEVVRLNRAAGPSGNRKFIHAVVGAEGATVTLNLNKNRQSSSVCPWDRTRTDLYAKMEENADRFTTERTVELPTRGLRLLCEQNGIADIDLLKVDTEGHEFPILKEAPEDILAVEVEVTFHPLRLGTSLFDQVMSLMRGRRYLLVDVRRYFWSPDAALEIDGYANKGFVILGDALFFLDPFLPENEARFRRPGAAPRFLAMLCLYGYGAEALMVAERFRARGLMTAADAGRAAAIIRGGFRGRKRLPRLLGRAIRKGLTAIERRLDLPFAVEEGVGVHPLYRGDEMLGTGGI